MTFNDDDRDGDVHGQYVEVPHDDVGYDGHDAVYEDENCQQDGEDHKNLMMMIPKIH